MSKRHLGAAVVVFLGTGVVQGAVNVMLAPKDRPQEIDGKFVALNLAMFAASIWATVYVYRKGL